jgi:CheY-like chemotaxis protein
VTVAIGTGVVVMVVDDDAAWRDLVCEVVALEGFQPVAAPNGRAALDLLRAGARPALLVTDLSMPVMSGWRLREEQLRDERLRDIPALAVSGNDPGAARFDGHLRKPCDIEELMGAVAALARRPPGPAAPPVGGTHPRPARAGCGGW